MSGFPTHYFLRNDRRTWEAATVTSVRRRLTITGTVQGVGFRPFIWRLARRHGLDGWVANGPGGVTVDLQGAAAAIDALLDHVRHEAPPLATVARIEVEPLVVESARPPGFWIDVSSTGGGAATGSVAAPESATCEACLAEICDPANRRHGYLFTTCTDCGPRFTIIRGLPYDRQRTTMAAFPMCGTCAAEYADPQDRRFHAEANACPACGPAVWFTSAGDPAGIATTRAAACGIGTTAIATARERLRAGDVLAVKGLGGFRLVCDATNATAVTRLRERKQRTAKPLAVMVADVETAGHDAIIDEQARRLLESRERPIVLVPARRDGARLAEGIAPGNDFVGLMLPAQPLEHVLCAGMPPLVMTSGNLAEEPIAADNDDAACRLGPLVDGFLMHDRQIVAACDDSVVRCMAGAALPIRRSRGSVPLPIRLATGGPTVLAVGGELKATLCLAAGAEAVMSQHIGDVANLETLVAVERVADHLLALTGSSPDLVACDLHPDALSAAWARRFAAARDIPVVAVQHHEAHLAALLADQAAEDLPVIGVCFDGTGYGRDGTIQGGEFLVARAGVGGDLERAAHLDPFPLPGGDAAIRHPWRVALAVLHAAGIEWTAGLAPVEAATPEMRRVLRRQLETGLHCVATSSMGRLFDAVAALAGVKQSIGYEAEAAMNLEALAAIADGTVTAYPLPLRDQPPGSATGPLRIDWRPLVAGIVADVRADVGPDVIAARFHRGVAALIVGVCERLRAATGIAAVALTGGVFQNARLVQMAIVELEAAEFTVLVHAQVPPNDGGLALGQAVLARRVQRRQPLAECLHPRWRHRKDDHPCGP
jgi:hydrogenase maturation protein HypF